MQELILQINDLYYSYPNRQYALSGVSADIYQGEKIAVLGSNGAGKSTFFLNLNGVLQAHGGEIIYRGCVINKKNIVELRKNVGIVFQDADNQIVASTVRAEVGFGPMNLKLSEDEVVTRVNEALEYMNLSEYIDRPPHYLSGGEKKRVSIADIIAMKSEVIIFDEPMAALDPLNAQMLEDVLAKLQSENKTLIISTHDVDFAYRWADRLIVFSEGTIIADGAPLEIFAQNEILKRANLKKPMLLEICELLRTHHMLHENELTPRNIAELRTVIESGHSKNKTAVHKSKEETIGIMT